MGRRDRPVLPARDSQRGCHATLLPRQDNAAVVADPRVLGQNMTLVSASATSGNSELANSGGIQVIGLKLHRRESSLSLQVLRIASVRRRISPGLGSDICLCVPRNRRIMVFASLVLPPMPGRRTKDRSSTIRKAQEPPVDFAAAMRLPTMGTRNGPLPALTAD
jgi:hypothetical protein